MKQVVHTETEISQIRSRAHTQQKSAALFSLHGFLYSESLSVQLPGTQISVVIFTQHVIHTHTAENIRNMNNSQFETHQLDV